MAAERGHGFRWRLSSNTTSCFGLHNNGATWNSSLKLPIKAGRWTFIGGFAKQDIHYYRSAIVSHIVLSTSNRIVTVGSPVFCCSDRSPGGFVWDDGLGYIQVSRRPEATLSLGAQCVLRRTRFFYGCCFCWSTSSSRFCRSNTCWN